MEVDSDVHKACSISLKLITHSITKTVKKIILSTFIVSLASGLDGFSLISTFSHKRLPHNTHNQRFDKCFNAYIYPKLNQRDNSLKFNYNEMTDEI